MKKGQKNLIENKKHRPGRRERSLKRVVGNKHFKAKCPALIQKVMDEMSKDRTSYFTFFAGMWENAAMNLNSVADAFMASASAAITEDQAKIFTFPFNIEFVILFGRLIDDFTCDEETRFRSAMQSCISGWSKLRAAMAMRMPRQRERIDALCDNAARNAADVLALYTGESGMELPAEYVQRFDMMHAALNAIMQRGGK